MAITANYLFANAANTQLQNITPGAGESGTGWDTDGDTRLETSGSGYLKVDSETGNKNGRETTDIADDDMDVSARCYVGASGSGNKSGVTGRVPTGVNGSANSYQAYLDGDGSNVDAFLDKVISSVRTNLGTYALNGTVNTYYAVKLEIRTAAKKVYIEGTERISSADDNLTGNNFAGVIMQRNDGRLDDWQSESVSSGTPVTVNATEVTATFSLQDPAVTGQALHTASELQATFALQDPSVTGEALTVATLLELAFSLLDPSVYAELIVNASVLEIAFSIQDPSVTGEALVQPSSLESTFSVQDPAVSGESLFSANLLELIFSLQNPVISGEALISPSVFEMTFTVQDPGITGEALSAASVLEAIFAIQNPSIIIETITSAAVLELVFTILNPEVNPPEIVRWLLEALTKPSYASEAIGLPFFYSESHISPKFDSGTINIPAFAGEVRGIPEFDNDAVLLTE